MGGSVRVGAQGVALRGRVAAVTSAGTARMIRFAAVGATGIAVNQAALWLLVSGAGIWYLVAAAVATQCSTTWNFALTERFVFPGAGPGVLARYLSFSAVNNLGLLLRLPLLAMLTTGLSLNYLVSNLVTLALLFASRFVVSDRLIWRYSA
jgi:dolichol-phosphate mannosyltransferase